MMSLIFKREEKPAITGNAPSSFSADATPNRACCLTRQQPAAHRTHRQAAARKILNIHMCGNRV